MRDIKFWVQRHFTMSVSFVLGILLPLYLFASIAEDVVEQEIFFFDRPLLLYMHSHTSPALDAIMYLFTQLGTTLVLVPFNTIVFVIIFRRNKNAGLFWLSSVGGAALLNILCKNIFERTRPDLWVSMLPESTFSFPSGHAMQSMAMAAAFTMIVWQSRWKWWALVVGFLCVMLVSLSRIYWGVHYPSDILAGWAGSFALVMVLRFVFNQHSMEMAEKTI